MALILLTTRWFIVFMFVIGVVLLCFAGYFFNNTYSFLNNSAVAKGVVIANRQSGPCGDDGSGVGYRPVVEFVDKAGKMYTTSDTSLECPAMSKSGDTIYVRYNLSSPEIAQENSVQVIWASTMATLIFGLFFTMWPAYSAYKRKFVVSIGKL
jgi:hypothetical protein